MQSLVNLTLQGYPRGGMDKVHRRRQELFYVPDSPRQRLNSGAQSEGGLSEEGETEEKWSGLADVLWKHFLFSGTTKRQIERITESMTLFEPKAGEVIIKEGDMGDTLYVVERGTLHVTCSTAETGSVDVLGENRVFGELAVLYDSPRAATVTAFSENTRLWCLPRQTLHDLEGNFMSENLEKRAAQLKRIPEFENFDQDKLRRIAAVMQEEVFAPGAVICRQGEVLVPGLNDKFFTIAHGCVQVLVDLSRSKPSKLNNSVSVDQLDVMMEEMSTSDKDTGEVKQDTDRQEGAKGTDKAENATEGLEEHLVATLRDGQWFGEMALLNNDPRSATVKAVEQTFCFTLSRSAFEQIVSNSRGVIRHITSTSELRKEDNHETMFRHERSDVASKLQGLDSLRVMHVIGEGAFSVVRLTTLRETSAHAGEEGAEQAAAFALKTMNKQDLMVRNQVLHVNNERSILAQTSHPFILSMIKTFQTQHHVYMLFELVQGGELFSLVINSNGGLPKDHVRFYAACITEGLAYLHRKRIAYRDLKLENLVVSADGYLKIIDFGFAKQLEHGETTRTLCGTPDYLAPEAVTRHGHFWAVDCWSLGVLIFELLTQYSPFADTSGGNDHMVVFKRIMKGADGVEWKQLRKVLQEEADFRVVEGLLRRLWDPNPYTRMTCSKLKTPHPYFSEISFIKLREKQIEAPWVPVISGSLDTSHFDVDAFKHVRESTKPYSGDQAYYASF